MNRRALLAAAALVGITPFGVSAETTCEATPPFIRQDDPIQALFQGDLHQWARTNPHIVHARVVVHPMFAYLVPPGGRTSEFETDYEVVINPQMPVPWAIVPECG